MQEQLSVVIPVYNTDKYLERAIESVLQQTFPVYEVICVDDGSTDDSLSILNNYAKQDKRVKVIHKENGGLVSARKAGIKEAKGTYVAYVDSDDFIEPVMYEEMMELAVKYDADLVTSGFIRDYNNTTIVNDEKIKKGIYIDEQVKRNILSSLIDVNSFYRTEISPSLCNKVFKADKLKNIQMRIDDKITLGEDDAVVYPFLFRSNVIVVSGKNYYHYCIRESGSVMGVRRLNDKDSIDILLQHLEKEFQNADKPGLDLMVQFHMLKMQFLLLRSASKVLKYDGKILYPFGEIKKEGKILLFGYGKLGVGIRAYLEEQGFSIVGWVDKFASRQDVIRPENIDSLYFDYVIITVLIADVIQSIRKELEERGIEEEKILYLNAKMMVEDYLG